MPSQIIGLCRPPSWTSLARYLEMREISASGSCSAVPRCQCRFDATPTVVAMSVLLPALVSLVLLGILLLQRCNPKQLEPTRESHLLCAELSCLALVCGVILPSERLSGAFAFSAGRPRVVPLLFLIYSVFFCYLIPFLVVTPLSEGGDTHRIFGRTSAAPSVRGADDVAGPTESYF